MDIREQAMVNEYATGRNLVGNSLGDRCAFLASEIADRDQRIKSCVEENEKLKKELEELKPKEAQPE